MGISSSSSVCFELNGGRLAPRRLDGPPVCGCILPCFLFPRVPPEIRTQLVEQFKCLEQQSESRLQLLQDLQEFFRRKAEIELEYSRSLEKLAERFSSKIRGSREHQFK